MDSTKNNRRNFLKNAVIGTVGLSSFSLLSSCSSFDDYLFEDRYNFNDEVMIVGGGISGLYLAHKLRINKTEFRLFEGANSFGGRIKSLNGADFGASLLSANDKLAKGLVNELALQTKALDKDYFYLNDGMQSMPDVLLERIIGLIPYRNFRLRWKLVSIQKFSAGFELIFENPNGQKRFNCKKIALAIPPGQWSSVSGLLELPEMHWASDWLKTLKVENTIKLVLPNSALPSGAKPLVEVVYEDLHIRQIIKKNRAAPFVEIDVKYLSNREVSIDYIYDSLKKKLQLNYPFQKLSSDQFYDWHEVKLIKGSGFRNYMAIPESINNNFQIVGDFTANKTLYTIEGALQSATLASELLL